MKYGGLFKVISGGQTGADQGGLIAAHKSGLLTGGTAPENWATSTGPNALLELLGLRPIGTLQTRTAQNIKDSDGTVIFTERFDSPGSVLTRSLCAQHKKPYIDIDLKAFVIEYRSGVLGALQVNTLHTAAEALHRWIIQHQISTLNVAGNREWHRELLITDFSRAIMLAALELLDLDNLLIRDCDF